MEMTGIQVDRDTLRDDVQRLRAEAGPAGGGNPRRSPGEKFNVGSPKQLGEILFDRLQIPGGEKGKTDAYGTGADILEDITTLEDPPPRARNWPPASWTGARSPS
jgi:DNA polymerase I